MIKVVSKGSFKKTIKYLGILYTKDFSESLDRYAQRGVEELQRFTPQETGETAYSWYYEIHKYPGRIIINWCNSNSNEGIPIAILIQYGHGMADGGYVVGRDFINPALQPVFDDIAEGIWSEVRNA